MNTNIAKSIIKKQSIWPVEKFNNDVFVYIGALESFAIL